MIQLRGMEELISRLERMGNLAETVKDNALMKGAEHLRQQIQNNAPVGPGRKHIKDNIIVEKKDDRVLVGPEKSYFYGHFIEFGFYNKRVKRQIPARPFMGPAFENNISRIEDKMSEEIKRALNL